MAALQSGPRGGRRQRRAAPSLLQAVMKTSPRGEVFLYTQDEYYP